MTVPANATPLERMLDAVAHLTTVALAVRDGVYDEYSGAPNYLARSAALLVAADVCEQARKVAFLESKYPHPCPCGCRRAVIGPGVTRGLDGDCTADQEAGK